MEKQALKIRGGVRVPHFKDTAESGCIKMPAPPVLVLPMQQHIGEPCICAAYLLEQPINSIIAGIVNVSGLVNMKAIYAVVLVAGSMVLTLIAGIIPSSHAARKNPVEALRTE